MEAHQILGIQKDASEHQIRVAYKAMAMKWHPDRQPHNQEEATAKFAEINKANRTLRRNLRRAHRSAQAKQYNAFSDESSPHSTFSTLPNSISPSQSTYFPIPQSKCHVQTSESPSLRTSAAIPSSRSSLDEESDIHTRRSFRSPNPSSTNVASSQESRFSSSPKPSGNKLRKPATCRLDRESGEDASKKFPRRRKSNPKREVETLRPVRAGLRGCFGADAPKKSVHVLNVTLNEICQGQVFHFRVIRYTLSGTKTILPLNVRVPPGSRAGTEVIIEGVGNELRDGRWQDISFLLKEMRHDRFRRVHDDLVMDVRLPWVESLNSREAKVYLEGVDQTEYMFNVDYHASRLRSGTAVILAAGMPSRDGTTRGKIIVRWRISPPSSSWEVFRNTLFFRR